MKLPKPAAFLPLESCLGGLLEDHWILSAMKFSFFNDYILYYNSTEALNVIYVKITFNDLLDLLDYSIKL